MPVGRPMVSTSPARRMTLVLTVLGILVALAVGLELRLDDPLSSPVLAAEDTYTHMAYVREHLRDGTLDPQNPQGALYPPGMHAFVAVVWVYTGADLYDIFRFGPAALGVLSILGMAILLWRLDGPVAGFVGAFAMAVAPEAVLRSSMMAPTALDLALLPFFLLSIVHVMQGRMRWLLVATTLGILLLFSHPWLFTIFLLAGLVLFPLVLGLRWPRREGAPITWRGLGATTAVIAGGFALSLSGCFGACGPGFRDVHPTAASTAATLGPIGLLLAAGLVALVWFTRRKADRSITTAGRGLPWPARLSIGIGFLVILAIATQAAVGDNHLPRYVDLPGMFGWPTLVLALLALLTIPFATTPLGLLALALGASLFPFVMFNPLDSPFWPHRTAVYLGFAMMVLAGVAAGAIARYAQAFLVKSSAPAGLPDAARVRPFFAIMPVMLLTLSVGASMYVATPESNGWYRLYTPCEFDALQEVAADASNATDAVVITSQWQPKLVLAAHSEDASRVWMDPRFFTNRSTRDYVLSKADGHEQVYVVVERYVVKNPATDTSFLNQSPWREVERACTPSPTGGASVVAYTRD